MQTTLVRKSPSPVSTNRSLPALFSTLDGEDVVFATSEAGGIRLAPSYYFFSDYGGKWGEMPGWKRVTEPVTVRFPGTKPGQFPALFVSFSGNIAVATDTTNGVIIAKSPTSPREQFSVGYQFNYTTNPWEKCPAWTRILGDIEITFDPSNLQNSKASICDTPAPKSATPPPAPKIAEGNNPHRLTDEQVQTQDGWRLLTRAEIDECGKKLCSGRPLQAWQSEHGWSGLGYHFGNAHANTYRTKQPAGYFLPKPKIAEGHNPRQLTEEQVGVKDGWRLLSLSERRYLVSEREAGRFPGDNTGIEIWTGYLHAHWARGYASGSDSLEINSTYRTRKPAGYYDRPEPKLPIAVRVYSPRNVEGSPISSALVEIENATFGRHVHVSLHNTGRYEPGHPFIPQQNEFSGAWAVQIGKAAEKMIADLEVYEEALKSYNAEREAA